MKKLLSLLLLVLLVGGAVILVKKKREELANLPTATLPPLVIKVVKPQEREVMQIGSYLATYHADDRAQLATKFAGTIEKIYVKESDRIKKGDLLVQIDSAALRAAIKSAEAKLKGAQASLLSTQALLQADQAALEVAEQAYYRAQKLYKAEAISKEALQKAKASYLAAKAKLTSTQNALKAKKIELQAAKLGLEAKRNDLAYTTIRAPFDGIVERLYFKEGSFAPTGKPILSIIGSRNVFDILFDSGLRPGMQLADYPCKIDQILPYAKESLKIARSYCQAPLAQESSQTIRIVQKRHKGVALPLEALYEHNGQYFVFVLQKGTFHQQKIAIKVKGDHYFIPDPAIHDPVAIGTHSELEKLLMTPNVKVVRE